MDKEYKIELILTALFSIIFLSLISFTFLDLNNTTQSPPNAAFTLNLPFKCADNICTIIENDPNSIFYCPSDCKLKRTLGNIKLDASDCDSCTEEWDSDSESCISNGNELCDDESCCDAGGCAYTNVCDPVNSITNDWICTHTRETTCNPNNECSIDSDCTCEAPQEICANECCDGDCEQTMVCMAIGCPNSEEVCIPNNNNCEEDETICGDSCCDGACVDLGSSEVACDAIGCPEPGSHTFVCISNDDIFPEDPICPEVTCDPDKGEYCFGPIARCMPDGGCKIEYTVYPKIGDTCTPFENILDLTNNLCNKCEDYDNPTWGECGDRSNTFSSAITNWLANSVYCLKGTATATPLFPEIGTSVGWYCSLDGLSSGKCIASRLNNSGNENSNSITYFDANYKNKTLTISTQCLIGVDGEFSIPAIEYISAISCDVEKASFKIEEVELTDGITELVFKIDQTCEVCEKSIYLNIKTNSENVSIPDFNFVSILLIIITILFILKFEKK